MRKVLPIIFLSLLFFSLTTNVVQAKDEEWCKDIPIEKRVGGLVPCGRSCDDPSTKDIDESESCKLCSFFVMIDNWIDGLLFIFIPSIAVLMIAIGGVMYIFSQGNPEMLGRVKKLFTAVVIGLLITYGAFLIIGLLLKFIGLADWTTDIYYNWWDKGLFEISCD